MRKLIRYLLMLVAVAGLLAGGAYLYLRQSLAQTEGTIRIDGLTAPIELLRDAYGIPHIRASSIADAYFGLGFAHAQDRLWQMEMSRRIAAGRLAEILGAGALDTDRFLRTLGVRRAAEASLAKLDPDTRTVLEAYAAGVNAFLATRPVLPPEFWMLRVTPEPWTPADSLAWIKMMAWDLGANWKNELLRMRLAKTLPQARIDELLPPSPGDAPLKIRDLKKLYGGLAGDARTLGGDAPALRGDAQALGAAMQQIAAMLPDWLPDGAGSNNWVVSGKHSASGKPLLANDPHLGLSAPPVWYFAQLSAPGLDAIGATLPGVPGIVLGRNERIAWGATNTGPDVQDLYLEQLEGRDAYLTPEGPRSFAIRQETIKVRGEPDVKLLVRITRHGPVVSDVLRPAAGLAPRGHVLAFEWTALGKDDTSIRSVLKLARAGNWQEFRDALRDLREPQQNIVYADVDGNIGFIAAGRVPVRKRDNDLKGLAPAPGWEAKYDWAGWIPFDELPQSYNPPEGEIVTANQKIVPPGYTHFITSEWQPPYRAQRIRQLLAAVPRHTVPSFARIQADVVSLPAREQLPRLLATKPLSAEAKRALALLAAWDGSMAAERTEPLIMTAWWRALARAIYADELGDAFDANWLQRPEFIGNVLADKDGQSRWCDDVRTPKRENCGQILSASLEAALADLRQRYGKDMRRWKWGQAHPALHEHRPFGRVPLLARLFDISVPSPGGAFTVDVGRSNFNDAARPYASRHGPSLRAIYDLSNMQASLFIHSGGQSGNPLSPGYRAFTRAWAAVEYIPMLTDRARIVAEGAHQLTLAPK
ncbi:MAG: penicillin acylase family protein [Burkholderiales bacterium]